jgi:predicted ATPase
VDSAASATAHLAHTKWQLGEVDRARELIEESVARAIESAHGPTLANTYTFKALFEMFRGDAEAGRHAAESILEVSREHHLPLYLALGSMSSSWARARLGDRETGVTELRQALAAYADQGNKLIAPFFQGLLAEFEAEGQDMEGALARIGQALALASEIEEHLSDALLSYSRRHPAEC